MVDGGDVWGGVTTGTGRGMAGGGLDGAFCTADELIFINLFAFVLILDFFSVHTTLCFQVCRTCRKVSNLSLMYLLKCQGSIRNQRFASNAAMLAVGIHDSSGRIFYSKEGGRLVLSLVATSFYHQDEKAL